MKNRPDLYPQFAEIAQQEGFPEVAAAYKMIARVEAEHERRYLKLLQNISEDKVFMKNGKVWWKCINCGYVYEFRKSIGNVSGMPASESIYANQGRKLLRGISGNWCFEKG